MGELIEVSESTLYPILKRLEAAGQVTVCSVAHNGRLRRYYRVTDAGRGRVAGFLEEWQALVRLFNRMDRRQFMEALEAAMTERARTAISVAL